MRRYGHIAAVFLAFTCGAALAADPGSAQGVLEIGAGKTELKFARGALHDNAEGLLEIGGRELRIALTDVAVAADRLIGIAFLPVTSDGRDGKLRGVLMTLKPNDPNHVFVSLLAPVADPGSSAPTLTLYSEPEPIIANFKMDGKTVSGSIKFKSESFNSPGIAFSAAITPEPPVTADLKGKAAVNSPQVQSMRLRAQAMVRGDAAGVAKLSTPLENRQLEIAVAQIGPQASAMMRDAGRGILPTLATVERVVVRGDHAVVIFKDKGSWQDMALIDGQWKTGK